jgi:hypothetical protein
MLFMLFNYCRVEAKQRSKYDEKAVEGVSASLVHA